MRRMTGCCCLALLLAGCANQQTNSQDAASATPMVNTSSVAAVSRMFQERPANDIGRLSVLPPSGGGEYGTVSVDEHIRYGNVQQINPSVVREVLLKEYADWAGTRYRLGGTTRRGIDCSALMQHVFRSSFDYQLPRTTTGQVLEGKRVEKSALRPGDLVFFRPYRGDRHVGVYVGDGYFMHASSSQGVKLSRLDEPYWTRHYWTARRTMDNSDLIARVGPSDSSRTSHGYLGSANY